MEDKRFSHISSDPKFRRVPKGERKVKIDKRFTSMFENKNFKVKYTVDKRGRPVDHSSAEDLKRYYDVSSEEEEESSSDESEEQVEESGRFVKVRNDESSDEGDLEKLHKQDKKTTDPIKKKLKNLKVDYARGEGKLLSDSSSEDEESEDNEELDEDSGIEHKWGELDCDAESTEEITHRLAACNMDWDRIRAVDIMVLLNSFLPANGTIKSVVIYPSEFGKQRMKEEETKGPIELVENVPRDEINEETEEGSRYHMEKLRQYQLNRLKYYYAVITFDSEAAANKIYTECDGMEYESSATKMDLRFIPDDMTFEDEPKEVCDKLPDLSKYQPRFFTTTALQQAKVSLTWDETDPERLEIATKLNSGKIEEIEQTDLKNYLAGSSDSEAEEQEKLNEENSESDGETTIEKYKSLLEDIEQKEQEKKNRDVEMEVSWGLGLMKKTEELVKKAISKKDEQTPFQEFLEKRKEKRKERKKKNKLDEEPNDSDVPSDIDMNDPYFAEEFKKGEFEKPKKKNNKKNENEEIEDKQKEAELELLLMDAGDDKNHFSLKSIQDRESTSKSKKKKQKQVPIEEDNFQINPEDPRFSAIYSSHLYNIDPSDPRYKKTKGMEKLIDEKLKRKIKSDDNQGRPEKMSKKDAELNVLVKSVKRSAENYKKPLKK